MVDGGGHLHIIMVVSRHDNISVQVDHEGESLEQVHDFKFLGAYKSADGGVPKKLKDA